jgi:DNA-binding CsgD family transcriptional regulator
VLALYATYALVLPESVLTEALAIMPQRYRKPFKERCQMVSNRYGLTEREAEVMALFAKGRDSAYIQQTLSLSKSTVSTHRQHIYVKLGVHSQQELLNLLYELEAPAQIDTSAGASLPAGGAAA